MYVPSVLRGIHQCNCIINEGRRGRGMGRGECRRNSCAPRRELGFLALVCGACVMRVQRMRLVSSMESLEGLCIVRQEQARVLSHRLRSDGSGARGIPAFVAAVARWQCRVQPRPGGIAIGSFRSSSRSWKRSACSSGDGGGAAFVPACYG